MTRSTPFLRLFGGVFAAVLFLSGSVAYADAAHADVAPPAQVLSRWETSVTGNVISRDCGFSKKLPGSTTQTLWLFCDSSWSGSSSGLWLGATAAVGSFTAGQVPTALTEIPTPPAAIAAPSNRPPAGFLPVPSGLLLPDGTTCQVPGSSYGASWISGAAQQPSTGDTSKLLITYADVCAYSGGLPNERYGLVEYKPSTNTLSNQTQIFTNLAGLPYQQTLGSPVFSGGYLYLIGYHCDSVAFGTCESGEVTLARVNATPASWRIGSNYRYWTGSAWSANYADAASILPGAKPIAAHLEDFSALGKGFVILEEPDLGGHVNVWRSSSLTSGWSITRTASVPCGGQAGSDLCRAYFGHPELSTATSLLMSYYDPASRHVGVQAIPW